MRTKWIKVPVTLIEIDGKRAIPLQNSAMGRQVNTEHPPMTAVEIEADEADRLLARDASHGAVEVAPPAARCAG
jgi:hypothetical protein